MSPSSARKTVCDILAGDDPRLLVVVGPCSIHDTKAAVDYAQKLKVLSDKFEKKLFLVMRTYFEKPRTTVGWKGFLSDPTLDGSHKINWGLREARSVLKRITSLGLPCATEFLDMTVPQYIADFIVWGAIGARTSESQPHRELASGLSMPIGFKNATDGRIQPAIDAVVAAREPHWFASNTKDGVAAHFRSAGNETCHIILRGGKSGSNYDQKSVAEAIKMLFSVGAEPRLMIDCSHDNSQKDFRNQAKVVDSVCTQLTSRKICGVMLESFLIEGSQPIGAKKELTYGQSITDSCINLAETEKLLQKLADSLAPVH